MTVAVAVPLMAFYALAYAATHPLGMLGYDSSGAFKREPGALERYRLTLINAGPARVTDIEFTRAEGSPALQLERAGTPQPGPVPEGPGDRAETVLRPSAGMVVEPGRGLLDGPSSDLELELRQGRLCTTPVARLDAIWIRYRVLGGWHEQRLPLDPPPSVRCG